MRARIVVAFGVALVAAATASPPAAPRDAAPAKPASHTKRDIEGWTVRVDDRLLAGSDEALGRRALGLLESQLRSVALVLPRDKVKRLREVPVWLDLTCGDLESPQYHPSADWLAEHGYSHDLAKAVHIPSAAYFTAARFQREQPWAVLHELAHAYHDQVLGFDHADIKAAWERFVKGGRYKSVLHVSGKERPHYALTNEKEFFAEMTETYFGQNDFFPFNSAELRREEPELFRLMAKIWGPLP
jgi:hypothetical protein